MDKKTLKELSTRKDMNEERQAQPVVGILTVEVFDDWLDDLGVSLNAFTSQMMGSWMFNYMQALQMVRVKPVLYCVSTRVKTPTRFTHGPTGATITLLPPPGLYRLVRHWLPKRPKPDAGQVEAGGTGGLKGLAYKGIRFLLRYFSTPLFPLFSELHRDGCRSLLVQEYESARFDLCVLLGKLKQVAVFGTFQGGLPHNTLLRPLRPLALSLCDGLLIPAKNEAKRVMIRYSFPAEKITLLYTPVDLSIFHPGSKMEQRALLGLPSEALLVIYHGEIHLSYKGLDVLLNAWSQVCQSRSDRDVRLVIIGTGRDAAEFSTLLSVNHIRKLEWVNQWIQDRCLIQRYLSSADIYVFPSRGDACPNAVIEAMACGLPIVASEVNGIADILEGGERSGGVLVPPGNAYALGQALGRLLDDKALTQELGQRAKCRAEASFSMEATGKQLSAVMLNGRH